MALADDPSGKRPRMFSFKDNRFSIYDHIRNAFWILMGISPCGSVNDPVGIENNQIGKITHFDLSPSIEADISIA